MAEANARGGRAGSVETAEAGFHLQFNAPSLDNPPGLTPEHRFGAACAACFPGALNDIAKESGPADAGTAGTFRVARRPAGPQPNCG